MLNCAKMALASAVLGMGLLAAGGAQAANVNVCFGADVSNVALNSLVSGIENAIVVFDSTNTAVIKADNYFGNGAGTYWTSTLPQTASFKAGCYTFYFMTKSTLPAGTSNWLCNAPSVSPGSNFTVISGSLGNITTGFVLAQAAPTGGKNDSAAACPQGW